MYKIEQGELPQSFIEAWQYAGQHIQKMGQKQVNWLRATLNQPIAEHLSFRFGNQLFFIYVETDVLPFVGNRQSLFLNVAREANAIPCLLKMVRKAGSYQPSLPAWGLINAETGQTVNPPSMVTNKPIVMSDWELHDFAIQVIRLYLEKQGKKVFSAQSSLHIDPSIWFESDNIPHYVVVRADRYPKQKAQRPTNLADIKQSCAAMSQSGFFASVTVANADDPFDPSGKIITPLYRGQAMIVNFERLEPL
jgi:hypothetical protein